MSTESAETNKKPRFAPKEPITLDPPRYDPISTSYLAHCTGAEPSYPILVGIKGIVYDVTHNPVYAPGKGYNVFTGKDASCALGKSSLEPADVHDDISGLSESEHQTLDDWNTFFSYRYNVVGTVEGSRHLDDAKMAQLRQST